MQMHGKMVAGGDRTSSKMADYVMFYIFGYFYTHTQKRERALHNALFLLGAKETPSKKLRYKRDTVIDVVCLE